LLINLLISRSLHPTQPFHATEPTLYIFIYAVVFTIEPIFDVVLSETVFV
jgi:hypothetical protein